MTKLQEIYPPFSGSAGLQRPQTLDSSYYNMLDEEKLRARDGDQVVLKWFQDRLDKSMSQSVRRTTAVGSQKFNSPTQSRTSSPTHICLKLTCIFIDVDTIITSCPDRWHAGIEDTLVDTIRQSGIESFKEPEELIERILLECATFLDEFRYAGVGDHILDIFDSTMALRADDEVQCFKGFLNQIESREQRKRFDRKAAKSIAKEIRLIYEIRDIRDEVHLLRRVFEAQLDVLEKFTRIFWPGTGDNAKQLRIDYLEACGTKALIDRTTRLDDDASRTLQELDYLVQVKQTQTSLDEAEAARSLNNFIMLFTIVTILFAPLSFMTSLFAMPVTQFPHDDTGDLGYSAGWVGWRMCKLNSPR
ncbi:hypothetical protein BGZ63DRAFT_356200 [Mariannaea sp. PMI_226]|nr:hypothetical protein BGZ63DRAFT_356200 [Mariannaea sp. PMI_226]